jgi:nitrogen regulatory protein P-II 1
MKEINIFIRPNELSKVTETLLKHKAGITFYNIEGTGRTPSATQEIVHSYQTGRSIVPKFIGKTLVVSIVSDSIVSQIVKEIIDRFDIKDEPDGVLFVKDVSEAYELGSRLKGDEVLVSK